MTSKKKKPRPAPFGASTVEVEVAIKATPRRVWRALVGETTKWWPREFNTNGAAKGFHIEARLGGRMYEDWGRQAGVVWATVIGVDPPRSLTLQGVLLARFGGPASAILEIELHAAGPATRLCLADTAFGRIDSGPRDGTRDGWIAILGALRAHVER